MKSCCGATGLFKVGSGKVEALGTAGNEDVIGPADAGKGVLQALVPNPGLLVPPATGNPDGTELWPQVFAGIDTV